MIDRWMPILGRWHREMRLNYPIFWHLQTVYVAAFSVLASVAVAILAIFIPEQADNITPIEPGFFLLLAACIGVTAMWIRNFLRPPTWKQIANVAVAPGLAVSVFHGTFLLMPAFIYGEIIEYRIASRIYFGDVITKVSMLESYQNSTADLNFATLLDVKLNIPKDEWNAIRDRYSLRHVNPRKKLNRYVKNNLVPYLSNIDPIIYYNYYDVYEHKADSSWTVKLFDDLKLKDDGDGYTKDKAWECMLWHGLFDAIREHYRILKKIPMTKEFQPLDQGIDLKIAVNELGLSQEVQDDLNAIIQDNSLTIKSDRVSVLDNIGDASGIVVVPRNTKIIKINNSPDCNRTISGEVNELIWKWEGNIHLSNTLRGFIQFSKKSIFTHGDHRFFTLNSAPLKGWPLAMDELTRKSAQLQNEQRIVDRAVKNLRSAKYALLGKTADFEKFPWFTNWYWFGSKWMPFICLFILSSVSIGCIIARDVEAEEMTAAAAICASIIGLYAALLSAFGEEGLTNLILQSVLVGLFVLMLGACILAIYGQRVGVWWRWIIAATGLVLPFVILNLIAVLTRECTEYACGSRPDTRLPILAAGCVLLLVVGEAYLYLLRRAVIKPR